MLHTLIRSCKTCSGSAEANIEPMPLAVTTKLAKVLSFVSDSASAVQIVRISSSAEAIIKPVGPMAATMRAAAVTSSVSFSARAVQIVLISMSATDHIKALGLMAATMKAAVVTSSVSLRAQAAQISKHGSQNEDRLQITRRSKTLLNQI